MLEALGKEKAAKTAKTVGEVANSVKSVADGFAKARNSWRHSNCGRRSDEMDRQDFLRQRCKKGKYHQTAPKRHRLASKKDNEQLERRRKNEYSTQKSKTYDEEISFLEQQSELIDQQITEEQSKKRPMTIACNNGANR